MDAENNTIITIAIHEQKYFSVRILLKNLVDVSLGGGQLGSILTLAVFNQQPDLIKDLLESGINPDQSDKELNTPLHYLFSIYDRNPNENARVLTLLI